MSCYSMEGRRKILRELQRAVGSGSRTDTEGRTWRIVDRGFAGRQSLLLSISEITGYEGSTRVKTTYVAVARTGHAIVVLADIGWEVGDGHEAIVRQLAPAAVARAAILR